MMAKYLLLATSVMAATNNLTDTSAYDLAMAENCCTGETLESSGQFSKEYPTVVHHCQLQ